MFEREQLQASFDEILRGRAKAVQQLERLVAEAVDPEQRRQLEELRCHTTRHVELAERLLEIVE